MKKLIVATILILVTNSIALEKVPKADTRLQDIIAKTYKTTREDAAKAITLAAIKTDGSFPSKLDVLAIIAIESNFRAKAKNGKAKGFMQILYKNTITESDNVQAGVDLLKFHMKHLKTEKASVIAYNIGIGSYKSGKRNEKYYRKFLKERNRLKSIILELEEKDNVV